jgi:acyl CoA:acetate/3-ketoacid CoA transferase
LIEIAPGIDLQREVLDGMAFVPSITEVEPMPTQCFEA